MKRCFIAINLPETVKKELAKLISQLKQINPSPLIKYVRPEAIHLTLHFLGYLNDEQVSQVQTILTNVVKKYSATDLLTEKIDAFPNLKRPRVIYLASEEQTGEGLISLQKTIGQELEKNDIDVDYRAWQPHLTLARIKGPTEFKLKDLKIAQLKIPVNSIELMESQLTSKGAKYKIISSYFLSVKIKNQSVK